MRYRLSRILTLLFVLALAVNPALAEKPRIYLNVEPSEVIGGETAELRIGLSSPVPEDLIIRLATGGFLDLPKQVEVPANQEEVVLTLETSPVSTETPVQIRATAGERVQHQHVSLLPEPEPEPESEEPERRQPPYYFYPYYYYPWFSPRLVPQHRPGWRARHHYPHR